MNSENYKSSDSLKTSQRKAKQQKEAVQNLNIYFCFLWPIHLIHHPEQTLTQATWTSVILLGFLTFIYEIHWDTNVKITVITSFLKNNFLLLLLTAHENHWLTGVTRNEWFGWSPPILVRELRGRFEQNQKMRKSRFQSLSRRFQLFLTLHAFFYKVENRGLILGC